LPPSLRDESRFEPSLIRGHRQITDIYLLGLATAMGGRLVTLDRHIPFGAVLGATPASLTVVSSVDSEGDA
jgi:uncharacterized protein